MQDQRITLGNGESNGESGKNDRFRLSVLFIEDSRGWSAQILEHDIATPADNLENLFYEVERILISQIAQASAKGERPLEKIPPAPQKYWDMFRKSAIALSGRKAGLRQGHSSPPKISSRIRVAGKLAA